MREILFRGKWRYNGEWVEGHYVKALDMYGREIHVIFESTATFYSDGETSGFILVNPETICQYTGLIDKNGKKIWEGDICDRKEQYPEIVKYRDGDWTLDYSYVSHKESGVCYCNLGFYAEERKCVEVIGNIFDNPELLEA